MSCQQVQSQFSLYLYGELDFAGEEILEQHVAGCVFCERALAREKEWHAALLSGQQDASLELLSQCRNELKGNLAVLKSGFSNRRPLWERLRDYFHISSSAWSARLALASFLVILGFGFGRYVSGPGATVSATEMSLFSPNTHVRDVQPDQNGMVRISVDQIREGEVMASLQDAKVRALLVEATKDPTDAAIRIDSVQVLNGQLGADVRDALLYSVRHDSNAAVRLKALEGLRPFVADPSARETLAYVLEHDQDPAVRSEAIDILAPVDSSVAISPELAQTLRGIANTRQNDDYVRMRCLEMLRDMKASLDTY